MTDVQGPAKLRRDAGVTVESVSEFLDHGSLAVTTVYPRRLEGVEDRFRREGLPPSRCEEPVGTAQGGPRAGT